MSGTVWLVDEFGRGGIARYAADVAALLATTGIDARIATTTGGPAEGAVVDHRIWFARRGPGVLGKAIAGLGGLIAPRRHLGPGDVAWLPLGIRPTYEAAMVRAATATGARLVATVHNRRPHDRRGGGRRVVATAARCDLVVVHTAEMATWGRSAGLSPVCLPFPTPQEGTGPVGRITRRSLGLADDDTVVVLAGTLRPYKGVDVLLDALALTDAASLRVVLAGQVPDPEALSAAIAERALGDRVQVVDGYLSGGELLDVLDLADAIALPYRAVDHSGIGALAASRGLPAVGSDLPGVVELFGEAGRYAPPGDHTALAALLDDLPDAMDDLRAARADGRPADDRDGVAAAYASLVRPMLR